ncbi:ATP-binding cassette domain-containing protein [Phytoactinopolyspora alkaliphila]|uniref:ATP-binding cassette domain-containing protein n=1 Tax=Phytoactinopolyspora alkaliphila TaxID=1783498 RepID=A0A6N9YNZ7_9ACTN|nr:oligopeptide/dipeptide ABC transporter ATP-binding protein [Phytoactinopolyspora alkaliphila]NED96766.1 ATP-binding cassette domain-containing protein [Phytoactinopolyspora alkaliphila]
MTPILELDDVRKHYSVGGGFARRGASVRAVDGVSLRLERGETLGLVGESGCGKSTLARTLVLLEKPDSGEVRFDGRPVSVTDAATLRRGVQIVFQDPYTSLPPHMKVRRIIAEPLMIHRIASGAELRARVDGLIADVGLPAAVADKLPGQLSGGQRQRVSIARALALEPSLLIADESVSALDVSVQAQILNLLNGLRERHGLTLLFVSHDIGVVTYVSQRIAVMYLGKIVEMGPAADVYGQPMHPYTRALMAAVPSLERRGRERIVVRGDPPDPKHPPPGCAFHPRCPMAQDLCRAESPPVLEWLPGRHVACHFALGGESYGRSTE